ncbi:MAG: T9SS type A sorting domain-containing protein [bacterium]
MQKLNLAVMVLFSLMFSLRAQTTKNKIFIDYNTILKEKQKQLSNHYNPQLSGKINYFDNKILGFNKSHGNKNSTIYRPSFVDFENSNARMSYTYDTQGNMLTENAEELLNGEWVCWSRCTYTYDSHGNKLMFMSEWLENGKWVNQFRCNYSYDIQGNISTMLVETWENDMWVNNNRDTYTYDEQGNMITLLTETWVNGLWMNMNCFTYKYSVQGDRSLALVETWVDGSWKYTLSASITYNPQGNLLTILYEIPENGGWVNNSLDNYSYDTQGNLITLLIETWENEEWVNSGRNSYTYDFNNNRISGTFDAWDGKSWIPGFGIIEIAYNANKDAIFFIAHSVIVRYVSLTGIEDFADFPNNFTLTQNYPNPFNPSTTISFSIPKPEFVTLKIFDILGNEVANLVNEELQAGSYNKEWNPARLASGIYFYRLQAGQFNQTRKMNYVK